MNLANKSLQPSVYFHKILFANLKENIAIWESQLNLNRN